MFYSKNVNEYIRELFAPLYNANTVEYVQKHIICVSTD